jgi:F420-dependent oxidoreductase-like protein
MRLTIFTEPQQGAEYDTLLRVAKAAEEYGFDGFFRSDHYLKMGSGTGLPGPTDAWITLAGLARETSRIRLGTLMTAATFRLPGPLAIAVATVDQMSRGRVELGIGAGWYEEEHTAHGIPFPGVRERFDRLEEQLEIITGIWRTPVGETYSFEGTYYQVTDSPALPKPYGATPPVLVGGFGPKRTPRIAARFADEFNVGFSGVSMANRLFDNVRAASATLGRDKEPLYSVAQVVCCGRNDVEVSRRAARLGRDVAEMRKTGLAGSPSELVEKIGRFAEVGCQRIHLQVLDLDDLEHLELIAQEVMPQVGNAHS